MTALAPAGSVDAVNVQPDPRRVIPEPAHTAPNLTNRSPEENLMSDTDNLSVLAPLAKLIEGIVRTTPIRLGPGGTDDLAATLTVRAAVWVGKNVLPRTAGMAAFVNDVDTERQAQLRKWGEQHHPDGTGLAYYVEAARVARRDCQYAADSAKGARWSLILLEEVYEALAESDPALLRAELVQSAAVIAAWIADLDQRETPGGVA